LKAVEFELISQIFFWVLALYKIIPNAFPSHVLYAGFYPIAGISLLGPVYLSFRIRHHLLYRDASVTFSFTSRETFNLIFDDPETFKSFQEFCIQKWCVEGLFFYREVLKYKKAKESERRELALEIKKQFLDNDAPLLANLDESTKNRVLERMQNNDFGIQLFDEAEKEVGHFLRYGVHVEWIQKEGRGEPIVSIESERFSLHARDESIDQFKRTEMEMETELQTTSPISKSDVDLNLN